MPSFSFLDFSQFLGGQIFGRTEVPDIDLTGKTFIVTGANTGLGYEAVKHLYCCPLTLKFAHRARSELQRLDGFVANAGVEVQHFELAEDVELTLKVNVLSTFLLALVVLPKLKETAANDKVNVNLTFVGSLIHIFGPDEQLDIADSTDIFDALSEKDSADMDQRYPLSKLMAHHCARQLAETKSPVDTNGSQVVINWANPGWCQTSLSRSKMKSWPEIMLMLLIGWTAEKGSRNLVYAVTANAQTHGCYVSERQIKDESAYLRSERGRQIQEKLWSDLMNRVKLDLSGEDMN